MLDQFVSSEKGNLEVSIFSLGSIFEKFFDIFSEKTQESKKRKTLTQ